MNSDSQHLLKGSPGGSEVKNPPANARDRFNPWVGKIPWGGNDNPFLPGKSHAQKSLVGYSPWVAKELDMTQGLTNNNSTYWTLMGTVPGSLYTSSHCLLMQMNGVRPLTILIFQRLRRLNHFLEDTLFKNRMLRTHVSLSSTNGHTHVPRKQCPQFPEVHGFPKAHVLWAEHLFKAEKWILKKSSKIHKPRNSGWLWESKLCQQEFESLGNRL